jgi:hypothetical protein
MLTPQIFETPIRRMHSRFQWYFIVVSLLKDDWWRIEEEIKAENKMKAYLIYNRFLNHYSRYAHHCKINIYAQHLTYLDKIEEIIIENK